MRYRVRHIDGACRESIVECAAALPRIGELVIAVDVMLRVVDVHYQLYLIHGEVLDGATLPIVIVR